MPFVVRPLALKADVCRCAVSGSAVAAGFFRFDFVLSVFAWPVLLWFMAIVSAAVLP